MKFHRFLLVLVAGGGALWAEPAASTKRMIEHIEAGVRRSDPLISPYLVDRAAQIYGERLRQAKTPRDRLDLKMLYATALLNSGDTPAAIAQLEEYDAMLNDPQLQPTLEQATKFLELKAVAHLRLGEQDNCLSNHNKDSCLFPIRDGGVHKNPTGSRGAIAALTDALALSPTPNAIWLLNLAYQTLGEYPDSVPAQWLIPPSVMASEHDIKRFPDVAAELGLNVDDLAGGVAMDDFDRDGYLDLICSGAGTKSQLRYFHNDGNGKFTERTDEAGLTGLYGGLNINHTDYNNDGYPDVFVMRGGWQTDGGLYPRSLLRNNRDGTFTDVAEEAGLYSEYPTQTSAWFDYNGDGWLDLFIGNESLPQLKRLFPCQLYRNNGDGTFTECASESGVAFTEFVKGVTAGDFNNDGRPDLYLSERGFPNRLLRNDGPVEPGKAAWKFTDVTQAAGVSEPLHSFPCWFFDYDNDGWLDLFVSGYFILNAGDIAADLLGAPNKAEHARLYHNRGDGTFEDVTKTAGLWKVLHAMGSNYGDLDNDGYLDLLIGTGDPYLGTLIPNRAFRNDAGRSFQDVTASGGFGQLQKGHAVAFGDLNEDGAQDVYEVMGGVYTGDHYPNQLFANPGHGNHWLKLRLAGVESNRAAIGARVKVVIREAGAERAIHRVVGTGGSFGGNPLRLEVGLGQAAEIVRVEVFWPRTGRTQVLTNLALDRSYAVTEGESAAKAISLATFSWPAAGTASHHHH